jgi:hypothetical protein
MLLRTATWVQCGGGSVRASDYGDSAVRVCVPCIQTSRFPRRKRNANEVNDAKLCRSGCKERERENWNGFRKLVERDAVVSSHSEKKNRPTECCSICLICWDFVCG